jgi:hypothetical protein
LFRVDFVFLTEPNVSSVSILAAPRMSRRLVFAALTDPLESVARRKDVRRLLFREVDVLLMVPKRSSVRWMDATSKRFWLECAKSITTRALESRHDAGAIQVEGIPRLRLMWLYQSQLQTVVEERNHLIPAGCRFFRR